MAFKNVDDRQVIQRAALSNSIGTSANTTLDVVFSTIDSVMVNLAGLQKIQNKTIGTSTAGLLANTLQFTEIATPSTDPAVNTLALYPKSDGHFYSLNSSGVETQVGSGSALPVGSVVSSFLTLTQFQSQAGIGWVLAEGQSASGSTYEAVTGQTSVTASATSSVNTTGATVIFSTLWESDTGTTHANNILTNVGHGAGITISVGQLINGTGIPAGTTISSIDEYIFTLTGTADQYTFAVHSSNQYIFTVSSAHATAGAVYSNNGQTFTVDTTINPGTTLDALGTGAPTASGTLTLVSGTGDATITFSAFTYAGANATSGAVYSNNGFNYTVSSTISDGVSLTAIGTGDPTASGTLTKVSGTGDATITFTSFTFGAHNATAGATYTNNGQTFTVISTIDDGTTLFCTGTGNPSSSGSGTLTLATGTGDSTIPFSSVYVNLTMSQNATSSTAITVDFSNFVTSTTGNLTASSAVITNIANSSGIATGQIISVTGISPYATVNSISFTTVPDCRGLVLRGQNNGRSDGHQDPANPALAAYESDTTAVNGLHDTGHVHDPAVLINEYSAYLGDGSQIYSGGGGNFFGQGGTAFPTQTGYAALTSSDAETRVKAIVVNWFFRLN